MTGYYVTVVDGPKRGLLLGPFVDHAYAYAWVDTVRRWARDHAPRQATFAGFGTAKLGACPLPAGVLNGKIPGAIGARALLQEGDRE